MPAITPEQRQNPAIFLGAELIALRNGKFTEKTLINAARRLTRMALQPHLGDKPLASRELFLKGANTR